MAMIEDTKKLVSIRKSDAIIVYYTGDKNPAELFLTQIALDILTIFDEHLHKIGKKNKITLFLYTTGGLIEAPWPLVSLIREYCDEFEVIVPYKALSAGTLICLGADKILMTPLSILSPVDPQGSFKVGQDVRQIQVEDVTGFVEFAKGKVGVSEQGSLGEIMKLLSSEIPPSVLGSINRVHSLIRNLADKLLRTHLNQLEDHQIKTIAENLTEKLFAHTHLIGRKEAKERIGFKDLIDYATDAEERLIRNIHNSYKTLLMLDEAFNPANLLGDNTEAELSVTRAIIDSPVATNVFVTNYKIEKTQDPIRPFNIKKEDIGWKKSDSVSKKKGGEA